MGAVGRSERGAVPPMLSAVLAGLLGGATLGWAAQDADVLDLVGEPAPVELRRDRVDVVDCPDGTPVASLARGDRVLAIGRSDDGAWLEIRSPVDLDSGAWVPTEVLAGDVDRLELARLPVEACELGPLPTTTLPPETTTSSSTTSTSSTTTSTTTTTIPETTLPPTTLPPTTTTAPNTGPTITGFTITAPGSLNPNAYVHEVPDAPGQIGACASVVQVRFSVTDPQGVGQVTFQWSTGTGGAIATQPVTAGPNGEFTATFEFPQTAVPSEQVPPSRTPTFTMTAVDGLGASTTVVIGPPQQTFRVFDDAAPCNQGLPGG
jgi:hypothetical protein